MAINRPWLGVQIQTWLEKQIELDATTATTVITEHLDGLFLGNVTTARNSSPRRNVGVFSRNKTITTFSKSVFLQIQE